MRFKNLNAVSKLIAGQSPPSTTYNKTGEGLPFFQGKADFQEKYPKIRSWCTSKKKKEALPGDILMSVRAPVGPVNICNQRAVIGRGISAIRPLEGSHGDYLYYFLKSNEQNIAGLGTGSTFKAITKDTLGKIQVPLPIFDDQIRIATLLSRVEALIATRKDNLRLLDEFLKSTFLEMFGDPVRNEKGWEKKTLGMVSDSRLGKMRDKKFITGKNLRPYLGNSNVKWFKIYTDNLLEMDFNEKEREVFSLNYGDLLICEGGEIGRCAIWKNQIEDCYFQKALHRVRLYREIKAEYFQHVLLFYSERNGFKNVSSKSTIAHLTGVKLKETLFPVPPIKLQNQFATIVEKVESLKTRYHQNLNELENLYGALSQKAFKGELDLSRIPLEQQPEPQMDANRREYEKGFSYPDSVAMSNPIAREQLLRQLFDAYIGDQKGASFSLDDFWHQAELKVVDHMDEESPPLGVTDYDKTKGWLFEMLKSGQAAQHFNEENNCMELSIKG